MKQHLINETDGHKNWITVYDPDPITDMYCIAFSTSDERAKNPEEHSIKHKIFLTRYEFTFMSLFMDYESTMKCMDYESTMK
jgi:hypothetical protein